jgi:hypothetical protein
MSCFAVASPRRTRWRYFVGVGLSRWHRACPFACCTTLRGAADACDRSFCLAARPSARPWRSAPRAALKLVLRALRFLSWPMQLHRPAARRRPGRTARRRRSDRRLARLACSSSNCRLMLGLALDAHGAPAAGAAPWPCGGRWPSRSRSGPLRASAPPSERSAGGVSPVASGASRSAGAVRHYLGRGGLVSGVALGGRRSLTCLVVSHVPRHGRTRIRPGITPVASGSPMLGPGGGISGGGPGGAPMSRRGAALRPEAAAAIMGAAWPQRGRRRRGGRLYLLHGLLRLGHEAQEQLQPLVAAACRCAP